MLAENHQSSLDDAHLPGLYRAADSASREAQRRFIRGSAAQLILLVAAAVAAKIAIGGDEGTNWAQMAAAACFLTAAVVRTFLLTANPESLWYDTRAIAESVKTLAWRYAIGGNPFRVDEVTGRDADRLFVERVGDILQTVKSKPIPGRGAGQQITESMRTLRGSALEERQAVYLADRLDNQIDWYGTKAEWNERRRQAWALTQLAFELLGAVLALLVGTGVIGFELASLSATIVGAAAAWSQTKKHGRRSAAYTVAFWELSDLAAVAGDVEDEAEWAAYVEQVEQAISREHTIWRAAPAV
jgi:hypothetical protein